MLRSRRKPRSQPAGGEFLAFESASFRVGGAVVFRNTNWTWRAGEQWALLGPDGSGKSLLVEAILGRAMTPRGEVRGPFPKGGLEDSRSTPVIAHVSPQTQRELAMEESSFYQLRWHSGLDQSPRTVAQFLSQESVEDRNPFEVGFHLRNHRKFLDLRRRFIDWLGIKSLWRRSLAQLSNGEMRKTLLVHALLKAPDLLVLEDPYAGLDTATRRKLGWVVLRLMRDGWPVLVATHRVEEVPASTTHLLLIDNYRVVAQGPKREVLGLWRERFAPSDSQGTLRTSPFRPPRDKGTRLAVQRGPDEPLVELQNVTVTGTNRIILKGITWTLREGECWALLGPNGAGKTTLLNLIQGDHPQAYSEDIRLFGRRTDSTQAVWDARQHIGWMSPELHQHYPGSWNAEEVICSGFFNALGLYLPCSRRQRGKARQWLLDLGLGKHAGTPFGELSFGQQRLVLLARAAVKEPRLLILDEPCQGLDEAQRPTLLGAVDRVVARTGASLIFVTHHKGEVPRCITHTLSLAAGRIQKAGPAMGDGPV